MSRRFTSLLRPFLSRNTVGESVLSTPAKAAPTATVRHSSFLQDGPSPPRLPADQQAEFERLQREAEARLSSHNDIDTPPQPLATVRHVSMPSPQTAPQQDDQVYPGSLSGGIRQGAPPEFEGDVNPKTGEVGGPKNEPLRWGGNGDWSYNGRVTDF
ncbi:hypothetical protein B0T18DRAFT_417004 [Schizothecium vesticola]|uniref:Succinate dehydrogenase assembly factor 4, mitochondrial n=1 Tax=Schizothecium vesticola TaxID=314040 RepID=A0AA40BT97_9PEZI|nr:hypothetical protein B0T18DRAFT_417004 [Schizothecium vesticola]